MRQIIKFLQEVRTEFKNISWPKRESLIQLTFVVISISIIVSLILGGFDYLFIQGFKLLSTATKPPVTSAPIPTAALETPAPTVAPSPPPAAKKPLKK